jgi:hypothetical protein
MKSETSKLLMVALDVESHNTVNKFLEENMNTVDNKSIEILLDDISYHNFYEFNSNGFIRIVHKKLKIIHEKLLNSEILHYFDSDVVFLKNPEDIIKKEILDNDVVFQQDAPVADHNNKYHNYVCAGNFSIKNTTNSLKFISEIINRLSDHKNDQEVLYEYLNSQVSNITEYKHCKLHTYDQTLFQNGCDAFKHGWYSNEDVISIHANHMIGKENKKNAIEKMGMWRI